MTQKFTAEEVRKEADFLSTYSRKPAEMLTAYADTLSKPADSGRVGDVSSRLRGLIAEIEQPHQRASDPYIKIIAGELRAIAALAAQLEQITDGKAQWDEVANILGADGDNVDDVIAKATALAAQGQGELDPMEAIVEHCMVTEAVSPDSADPYGTISRVIDWHQANTAPLAGVPDGCIPIHRTLLGKLATDMDSIDMPKIGAAIRRWVANYDARQSAAPSATPEGGEVGL